MRLTLIDSSNAVEPLTLDEVKLQVRLPVGVAHPEDTLIEDLIIPAVRERAEIATQRALRQETWELGLDQWYLGERTWRGENGIASNSWGREGWLELPKSPVIEVLGLTYTDRDGQPQAIPSNQIQLDAPTGPRPRRARIAPAFGVVWNATRNQMNTVAVQFVAGYSTLPLSVYGPPLPPLLKMGLLIDAATVWAHRDDLEKSGLGLPLEHTSSAIYRRFKSHPTQRMAA